MAMLLYKEWRASGRYMAAGSIEKRRTPDGIRRLVSCGSLLSLLRYGLHTAGEQQVRIVFAPVIAGAEG